MVLKYTIKRTDTYQNVKEVLKAYFGISERLLLKLKNTQNILLNGTSTYVSKEVVSGDIIEVLIDAFVSNKKKLILVQIIITSMAIGIFIIMFFCYIYSNIKKRL